MADEAGRATARRRTIRGRTPRQAMRPGTAASRRRRRHVAARAGDPGDRRRCGVRAPAVRRREVRRRCVEDVIWTTIPDAIGVSGLGAGVDLRDPDADGRRRSGSSSRSSRATPGPTRRPSSWPHRPCPSAMLPGLAIVTVLMLASGVSLGPENPILAINIGLAAAIGLRLVPRVPVRVWSGLAFAGTLGAMFGTPVGAALAPQRDCPGTRGRPLWDRMFAPLVAAGAGHDHDDPARRRVVRPRRRAVHRPAAHRPADRVAHRRRRGAARPRRGLRVPRCRTRRSSASARRSSPSSSAAPLLGVLGVDRRPDHAVQGPRRR